MHPLPEPLYRVPPNRSGADLRRGLATIALAMAVGLPACTSNGGGRPDEALEGLVQAPTAASESIDVDRAATEVPALRTALALPHHQVAEALGSHRFHVTASAVVREDQQVVDTVAYDTAIEIDGDGNYHAVSDNDKDYGREVFSIAGELYLRPRHAAKFHRRPPSDAEEAARIRDDLFSTFEAYFDVLAARAELVDRGHAEVAGRAGRKIEIKTAPEARRGKAETATQRQWRNDVVVREVTGEVILDADTGGLLAGTLHGTAVLARDGRSFELALTVDHAISDIGQPIAVTAPAADQTVTSIEQPHEAWDREVLLKGIAPPARKAPTPPHNGDSETAP